MSQRRSWRHIRASRGYVPAIAVKQPRRGTTTIEISTTMVYLMTEKRRPHHDLQSIKTAFSTSAGLITGTAIRDASAIGYDSEEVRAIIQTITSDHFYKSMTAYYDNNIWQDVYHPPDADGVPLYVKFTDNGGPDFVLLSFKVK